MAYDIPYDGSRPDHRASRYVELMRDWEALQDAGAGWLANASNLVALLHRGLGFWWTGFYLLRPTDGTLVLGPFQGPVACTLIHPGKGVCGACVERNEPILVPDVDQFPGHIACSSLSRSELVLPLYAGQTLVGVLDLDSLELDDFGFEDIRALEPFLESLQRHWTGSPEGAIR
jgi:GAF domain-containing protein